jgi:glycine/D-amino acid oxidase-like deaminating enzyme
MCLGDDELADRARGLRRLSSEIGCDYPFEILDHGGVLKLVPQTGPDVVGAVFSPLDGHLNPLRLLRALVQGFESLGGRTSSSVHIESINHRNGRFQVTAGGVTHEAGRLVLAAGLGNRDLAPLVGLSAPVKPNRGQIVVTERLQPFLRHPTAHVRQTGEGVVQIGDSKEDVGMDDGTTIEQLSHIADRAIRFFPLLANVNIVRTWGALRVMSPDGLPIYQASLRCPGAFVVTCHSGITLAAQHAGPLTDWIRGAAMPAETSGFNAERFDHVQSH